MNFPRKARISGFLIFTFLPLLLLAQQRKKPDFGTGLRYTSPDTTFYIKANFRMQNLLVVSYDDVNNVSSSQFLIRRSRIKFDGYALTDKLKYKVELGLSNRDMSTNSEDGNGRGASRLILDAVLQWQFSKHWSLWAGQTKLPGNRERVISSGNLQFVDRSLLNSRYTLDRDAGFQLRGKYLIGKMILSPALAISQGEGRNITSSNFGGYGYTAHLEWLPMGAFTNKKGAFISSDLDREPIPKLALGLTFDYNDGAVRQGGQLGAFVKDTEGIYVENSLQSFFIDLMFKCRGFSILSEYANKQVIAGENAFTGSFRSGTGFNFQMGYLLANNWELAVRYTTVARDTEFSGVKDENQYTLGISKYIVGHNLKVQSDFTRISNPGLPDRDFQFRMQVEMQF